MAADRRKSDGALLVTDKPMSLRECIAWCGFISSMTGYAVSVMMGWVSNPVSWVMS